MNILDKIVAVKEQEVARLRPHATELKQAAAERTDFRDFAQALRKQDGIALIAEVKKASPSAGVICQDFDPVRIATDYERAGASALSVLTDEQFFQGKLEYLAQIRAAVRLPLLRKDFTIDELQIYEAAAGGADAILLIVAILDEARLKAFHQLAAELNLAALVEVHDEAELDRAVGIGASVIGVNNRNLKDFTVSLETTARLASHLCSAATRLRRVGASNRSHEIGHKPQLGAAELLRGSKEEHYNYILVAESGINSRADVEFVSRSGASAILVGESLMRSGDVAGKVKELLGKKQ